ncbi:MAG TPA: hypothetical protein VGI89_04895 [Rhizomicrobium sp.]|jgi:hypothetical protein
MLNSKILLTAAVLAVTSLTGSANAAPFNNHMGDHRDYRPVVRHEFDRDFHRDFHRPVVERVRVYDALRFHHYRSVGAPYFVGHHYVVRTVNRFGRTVLVEVNPYTGAFIGEFRI